MISALVVVLALALGLLAGLSFVMAVLNRRPGWIEVIGAAVAELVLVVQAIIAIVQLIGGHQTESAGTFILYLMASLLILPMAIIWATVEKSRWGSVVMGVGFLSLVVIVLRMGQVWIP